MAQERRQPDPQSIEQEPDIKEPPPDKPPTKVPEKTQEDMLEEDRFQSTDN
jgi:hypothetical protein